MLDRSAATSLCSAVSGLEPLSFDSASSFAGTFQNKKTHCLCFGLVEVGDVSVFTAAIEQFSVERQ